MARSNDFASYVTDVQKQTITTLRAAQDLTLRGVEIATGSTGKVPSPAGLIEAGFGLAGHVTGVVEVTRTPGIDAERSEQRVVHRALHVQTAEVRHVTERESGTLERALGGTHEVLQARLVQPLLHRFGILDVEEAIAAVR